MVNEALLRHLWRVYNPDLRVLDSKRDLDAKSGNDNLTRRFDEPSTVPHQSQPRPMHDF